MLRILALLLIGQICFQLSGQTYVRGAEVGDSILNMAIYHVQVQLHKNQKGYLELYWNRTDSNNYCKARVEVPSVRDLDPNHPMVLTTRIYQAVDGIDSVVTEYKEALAAIEQVSLRLAFRNNKACIYTSSYQQGKPLVVPFDTHTIGEFGASSSGNLVGKRHTLILSTNGRPPIFETATAQQIHDYLKTATDPNECLWQHLDRDFPNRGVRLAHKYVLASISDGAGGYYLVDMTNDTDPLMLKAHITPTIFTNNYDMVWYPTSGPVQDDDCYAEITMDSHLLTLNLPIIKASFRLRRIKH